MKNKILRQTQDIAGFTLFELLVSISIIAIMTALASVAFSGAQRKARDSRRMQDVKLMQTAAEQYYSQSGTYSYPLSNGIWTEIASWKIGNNAILNVLPMDPKSDNTPYSYKNLEGISDFCICAKMEDPTNNANSDDSCRFSSSDSDKKVYFCTKNQQ